MPGVAPPRSITLDLFFVSLARRDATALARRGLNATVRAGRFPLQSPAAVSSTPIVRGGRPHRTCGARSAGVWGATLDALPLLHSSTSRRGSDATGSVASVLELSTFDR